MLIVFACGLLSSCIVVFPISIYPSTRPQAPPTMAPVIAIQVIWFQFKFIAILSPADDNIDCRRFSGWQTNWPMNGSVSKPNKNFQGLNTWAIINECRLIPFDGDLLTRRNNVCSYHNKRRLESSDNLINARSQSFMIIDMNDWAVEYSFLSFVHTWHIHVYGRIVCITNP